MKNRVKGNAEVYTTTSRWQKMSNFEMLLSQVKGF